MARPRAEKPTCTPFLRGTALGVQLNFGKLKFRTPKLASVEPGFIAGNGYVSTSHPDYLTLNETIAGAVERLEQAFRIAQAAAELTEPRLKAEYTRLTQEAVVAVKAAERKALIDGLYGKLKVRVKKQFALPDLEVEIAILEAQLLAKRQERDNMRREIGTYEDDLLITYLTKYATRKGSATMAESTLRSHLSYIETIRRFESVTRIQDVDEKWLIRFQDWLIATPSRKPIYSTKPNPDYAPGNGQKQKIRGEILRYKEGDTLKNSSVEGYVQKVISCLKFYQLRPEELPTGVVIDSRYKLYEFDLLSKEDNVVALEEAELLQLLSFKDWAMREQERARDIILFLCATSLRLSDLKKVIPANIKDGHISLVAKKTRKHKIRVTIPINPISRIILEKYGYDMRNCILSKNKVNRRIREVLAHNDGQTFASLQEPHEVVNYSGSREVGRSSTRAREIGTHSGRRTFINICLDYNVPVNKIIGMTGHTDVNTLMIYANKRRDVKKHMQNVFQIQEYGEQDYSVAEVVEEE